MQRTIKYREVGIEGNDVGNKFCIARAVAPKETHLEVKRPNAV